MAYTSFSLSLLWQRCKREACAIVRSIKDSTKESLANWKSATIFVCVCVATSGALAVGLSKQARADFCLEYVGNSFDVAACNEEAAKNYNMTCIPGNLEVRVCFKGDLPTNYTGRLLNAWKSVTEIVGGKTFNVYPSYDNPIDFIDFKAGNISSWCIDLQYPNPSPPGWNQDISTCNYNNVNFDSVNLWNGGMDYCGWTNSEGTGTWTIVSTPTSPVADFTANPTSGAAPLSVQFTDASQNQVTSWLWDFGDGTGKSTSQNPGYAYTKGGTYSVSLTVTGPGGSDTKTKSAYITVKEPTPIADFTANPTSGAAPLAVQFTDASQNKVTSWAWNFGDGTGISTNQNTIKHTYTKSGTYDVSLTATGPGGSDTKTKKAYIQVKEIPSVVVTDANLVLNYINITLNEIDNASGSLVVTLVGDKNSFKTNFNNGKPVGKGQYVVTLNRTSIPADIYKKINAQWKLSTDTVSSKDYFLDSEWIVKGIIRHSQYNTPNEAKCNGGLSQGWIFNTPDCQFTKVKMNTKFMAQVYINGSGRSAKYGRLKYSDPQKGGLCSDTYPVGATVHNTFRQVATITGTCNTVPNGISVATYPSPKKDDPYSCGDNILLITPKNSNKAIKEAVDYCPSCSKDFRGTQGHIDDYNSGDACTGAAFGDFGNFWTADTQEENQ